MDRKVDPCRRGVGIVRTLVICGFFATLSLFLIGGCDDDDDVVYWPPSKPNALVSATTVLAAEGGTQGVFTITLSKKAPKNLSIAYTVGGTADASDHDLSSGTVAIAKGATSATITVSAVDDDLEEVVETIVVTLISGSGYNVGSLDMANVAIPANDTPQATVEATDPAASEAGNTGEFTIRLSKTPMEEKIVQYSLSGSATETDDYTVSGSATISMGATEAVLTISPVDDSLPGEGPETVVLTVASGTGYDVGAPSIASVTINDDDDVGVTVLATQPDAYERNTVAGAFTITANPAPTNDLVISFLVSGTAIESSDYELIGTSATIGAGQTSVGVVITPIDDSEQEDPESATVSLISGTGYSIGAAAQDTVTIYDDEKIVITDLGMELMPIPAGSFMMGSPGGEGYRNPDEGPRHTVIISNNFWATKTEVTVGQFREFLLAGGDSSGVDFAAAGCPINDDVNYTIKGSGFGANASFPMCELSWHSAVAFGQWLTTREKAAGRLPEGYLFRLPTEAEWEYMCRSGSATTFHYGDDSTLDGISYTELGNYAHYNVEAGPTIEVGMKLPNAWGLHDMHGNVWEWCHDWYAADTYTDAPGTDPAGPTSGTERIRRGGSYGNWGRWCRSAARYYNLPTDTGQHIGFRMVLAPQVGINGVDRPVENLGIIMKPIPAGTFTMGSPITEPYSSERPQHFVTISRNFWMSKTEITQAQFFAITGRKPSGFRGDLNQPVETVSWTEAAAFCQTLTAREASDLPAGYVYRLPTSAEWEYACRAGSTTAFHYGDDSTTVGHTYTDLGKYDWYSSSAGGRPHPVAQKLPNPWGLYDMHGNVMEWTNDMIYPYTADPKIDPFNLDGTRPVLRGGCWYQAGRYCRSAFRQHGYTPTSKNYYWGFRIVLAPEVGPNGPDRPLPDLGIIMKRIPAGTFTMGSPDDEPNRDPDEGPQHVVTLSSDYWMSDTEITQGQYQTIMGNNPSYFSGTNLPVEQVSWNDAVAFCQALTTRETGNLPVGYEYRLPTEAEWEYACRAGTTTNFSYGQDNTYINLGNYAWFDMNSGSTSHPVRQKSPNPWGLYDMHGNVAEWCQDWYEPYSVGAQTDPAGPVSGSQNIYRGGSWGHSAGHYCRSADRYDFPPSDTSYVLGFRIVLAPKIGVNGVDRPINDLGIIMKPIPSGTFTMGSPDTVIHVNEKPEHTVTLSNRFWMAQTEITQAQYQAIIGSNPSSFVGDLNRPVETITQNDAMAFCQALTTREAANIPAGYQYRLPTEAEWEYACRAGSTTNLSYGQDDTYANLSNYAWYDWETTGWTTHAVKQKQPNPWALYDMHGNVWEWCFDWYAGDYYTVSPAVDPTGPATGTGHSRRGGSFADVSGGSCRSAFRGGSSGTFVHIGFRIVLAPIIP